MPITALDAAYAAMQAAPDDDATRLGYYERLADGELFLLLASEAVGDSFSPRVFDLDDGRMVLAFDSEDRLAEFTAAVSPYAALPGRVIAAALAGQGIGLGVNLGGAASMLLSPEAVDWLASTLRQDPDHIEATPQSFYQPRGLPQRLLQGLDAKLARAGGLAGFALLAGVSYAGGRRGHMLAFVDALPEAEPPLARACAEALTFSGVDAGEIDVAFLASTDPACAAMARVALRFDLPLPVAAQPSAPPAPGLDPDRPPRLR